MKTTPRRHTPDVPESREALTVPLEVRLLLQVEAMRIKEHLHEQEMAELKAEVAALTARVAALERAHRDA